MFKIGYLNNSGSLKSQCQYPSAAWMLSKPCTQSYKSTDPIIAEHGDSKEPDILFDAVCIKIRPRKLVFQERFSTSFMPKQICSANGFLMVNAFIDKVYNINTKRCQKKRRQQTAKNSKEQQYASTKT